MKTVKELIEAREKGTTWILEALEKIVEVNKELKQLDARRKDETRPYKDMIAEIEKPYKEAMAVLEVEDSVLREKTMEEREGEDSVKIEGVGEISFARIKDFELMDIKKVDTKYLQVNSAMIREDIRNGIVSFKGLKVINKVIMRVKGEK